MGSRELTLGHSPDADDAFMFYALAHDKLPTGGLTFRHVIADIETLNRRALGGELDVTALSVHAYAHVAARYQLLPSGASFGDRCGPIVVTREPLAASELTRRRIGVPGTMTSAFLLLKLLLRDFQFEVIPFDQIIDAVTQGRVDAGLLIHEGQLSYPGHGLHKVVDLGEWWHAETGLPVPLGVNGIRRHLGPVLIRQASELLTASVRYGLTHRAEALAYAGQFSRGLDAPRIDRFVGMYVNQWTLDMGRPGRESIRELLRRAHAAGLVPTAVQADVVGGNGE